MGERLNDAAENAPLAIQAFVYGCDTLRERGDTVPSPEWILDALAAMDTGFMVSGDTIGKRGSEVTEQVKDALSTYVTAASSYKSVLTDLTAYVAKRMGGDARTPTSAPAAPTASPPFRAASITPEAVRSIGASAPIITTSTIKVLKKPKALRPFLCHSKLDKVAVRELYERLVADGFDPWFDEVTLKPGQKWRYYIDRALREECQVVIACISLASVSVTGFVNKEIKDALDIADTQPEDAIFVIPARLNDCKVPARLSHLHWVNLYDTGGYDKLVQVLREQETKL
jgi:hypothetical protein